MAATGELIRLTNYVDDITNTLRRISASIPTMDPEERKRLALISTKLSNWVRFRWERRKRHSRGWNTQDQSKKRHAKLIWSSRLFRKRWNRRLRYSLCWTKSAAQALSSLPILLL